MIRLLGRSWKYKAFSFLKHEEMDQLKDYTGVEEWPSQAVSEKSFLCSHHEEHFEISALRLLTMGRPY